MPDMSSGGGPHSASVGRWPLIWRLIIAGGCLVLLATAPLPPGDTDALMYGKVAKTMLASGDWLTPRTDVPPLTLWLAALSLRLAGDSFAAWRLWHILATLALAAVTYRIARRAAGEEESLLAALLLLTTQQVLAWSLAPKQDIPLTLFLSLALYSYLLYRDRGRMGAALAVGVWVALAVLTKGPAALGAFGLIVGADLLVARRLSAPAPGRWAHAAAGAGVFVLVAAPWFLYETLRQGMPFVELFFLRQSTAWRFVRGYGVPLPYWIGLVAYVPLAIVAVLPWSGVLPGAIREGWRSLRGGAATLRLCMVWTLVVFLVLSLVPGTKSIRYLLPLYPPLAILGAHFLIKAIDTPRGLRTPAAVLAALWFPALVAGCVAGRNSPEVRIYLLPGAVFTAVVLGFLLALRWKHGRPAVAVLAVGTFVTFALFAWTSTEDYAHRWLRPMRDAATQIDRLYRPGDRVFIVGEAHLESDIVNYYLDGPMMVSTDEATLRRAWSQGGVLALLAPEVYTKVEADLHPVTLMETPTGLVLVTNR
jgi:4-amino-4-deoxy-L-arabinose transferase-like glycosyltransferase